MPSLRYNPFSIDIGDPAIGNLQKRLSNTRWPDEIRNSGWDNGTNLSYLKSLCEYWRNKFDWRKQEYFLNSFDHYKASVDNTELHFIYEKGKGTKNIPLLLTHGYPDSFYRFIKLIPLLTNPNINGYAFDVIIPSIPGFGFSEKPHVPGMNPKKIAGLFSSLMKNYIGYEKYAAHGGDWGSSITENLALYHKDDLLGIHLTDIPYSRIFSLKPEELSKEENKYLDKGKQWLMKEGAYALIQGTKPQTLAYGMNDSPAGLAAWIIEKFRSWSDCDGDIEKAFTKDELLTNISIYWFTETANSSSRIYYEARADKEQKPTGKIEVPTGASIFPKDMVPSPEAYGRHFFNILYWQDMGKGGHFAALEQPELLADELRHFFFEVLKNRTIDVVNSASAETIMFQ